MRACFVAIAQHFQHNEVHLVERIEQPDQRRLIGQLTLQQGDARPILPSGWSHLHPLEPVAPIGIDAPFHPDRVGGGMVKGERLNAPAITHELIIAAGEHYYLTLNEPKRMQVNRLSVCKEATIEAMELSDVYLTCLVRGDHRQQRNRQRQPAAEPLHGGR